MFYLCSRYFSNHKIKPKNLPTAFHTKNIFRFILIDYINFYYKLM